MQKTTQQILLTGLLFLMLAPTASAQLRTFLGVDVGPKWDVYRFEDQGNDLYTRPFYFSPAVSVNIGQEIHENIRLETGFSYVEYGESYRLRNAVSYGISNAIVSYQIPLRVKATLGLGSGRNFRIMPTLGYVLGINNDFESSGTGFVASSGPAGSFISRDTSNYGLQRVFHLIQTGINLEFQIREGPVIALGGNYFTGLQRIVDMNVSYSVNNQPESRALVYSNGNYFTFTLGFYYPISRIWTESKAERDWER